MPDLQRFAMRAMSAINIRVYRASDGRVMGKIRGVPVLLLTVAGRRTGAKHTTPVSYLEDDGRFVVTGSAGGAPSERFRNLRHADRAAIQVGPQRLNVNVTIAAPDERAVLWERLIALAPFFANYQAKVEREIPMAVLTPDS
jgi:F420H(2)-dependent quinone reductase